MTRAIAAALCLLAATGCDLDLERMIDQPRRSTYEPCDSCPGGTIMQAPPEGTVARSAAIGPPEVATGAGPAGWVREVPIRVDRALLVRGRNRFDIFCAACHGRLGNGASQVAENMTLRLPPSLLEPPYSDYPAGRIYAAAARGYGLMRSYAAELPVADRWAVVAYVQALQLGQRMPLDRLPPDLRRQAERYLR